jgi:hypothetical protein
MGLELDGHEVVVATSTADAEERLRNQHFDLLLVDEMLYADRGSPDSGSRILARLQAGSLGVANAGIPFAFVTAYSGSIDLDSVQSIPGYQGVFTKGGDLTTELNTSLEGLFTVPGIVNAAGNPLDSDSSEERSVVVNFRAAQAEILEALSEQPELLHALHHREFEELIAELFARNGCEVDLTSRTGDRGVDLYAVRQTGLGEHRYVVECKQNAPENRVGPALVRQLRGVVDRELATCGVLITTSTFTKKAQEEQQTSPHRLSLRDFEHVAGWLRGRPIFDH